MTDYADRLDGYINDLRLMRIAWTATDDRGLQVASLLAALSPDAAAAESADACPASICPVWWAQLTVPISRCGSLAEWPNVVRRYASIARRWHVLATYNWDRLNYCARAVALLEFQRHATNIDDINACERAGLLCASGQMGRPVDTDALSHMRPVGFAAHRDVSIGWHLAAAAAMAPGAKSSSDDYAAWDRMTSQLFDNFEFTCLLIEDGLGGAA